ncbi:hypothetical protein, partial [Phycicoccus endophyticus]
GPQDPAWQDVRRWPARGDLARDPDVAALVAAAAPGARLLYAADVDGARVVVAATTPEADDDGVVFQAWSGRAGQPAEELRAGDPAFTQPGASALVLAVPHGRAGVLLALAGPEVRSMQLSDTVRPTAGGKVVREWTSLPLTDGVRAATLERRLGPAARARCGDYDGPVTHPTSWDPQYRAGDATGQLVRTVAAATRVPVRDIRVHTTTTALPRNALVGILGDPARGRARLVDLTLPGGALVRTLTFTAGTGGSPVEVTLAPRVVPAVAADSPTVQLPGGGGEDSTAVVVVPGPAATVQLFGAHGGGPVSARVPLAGHGATVPVRGVFGTPSLRVRLRDAAGRVTYDEVPPRGRWLLDLFPTSTDFTRVVD